ncbi:MAG: FAD-dependent oxidoreductase [Pseudomonadales bacterium]|nr:FAD-dependent oxidoreductase [Pseudomonadales bacterium]
MGGRFSLAVQMHRDNPVFLSYLLEQMKNPAIDVRTDCELTPELVKELRPDVIVVATGARAVAMPIPGCEEAQVVSGDTLNEMIADCFASADLGKKLVILDSGIVAVELAEFLARAGKSVSIVSANSRLANEVGKKRRGEESKRLDLAGVSVNTGVEINEIVAEGVLITVAGKQRLVKADNVLIPEMYVADNSVLESLSGLAPEVYAVGDCTGFGLVKQGVKQVTELFYKI